MFSGSVTTFSGLTTTYPASSSSFFFGSASSFSESATTFLSRHLTRIKVVGEMFLLTGDFYGIGAGFLWIGDFSWILATYHASSVVFFLSGIVFFRIDADLSLLVVEISRLVGNCTWTIIGIYGSTATFPYSAPAFPGSSATSFDAAAPFPCSDLCADFSWLVAD